MKSSTCGTMDKLDWGDVGEAFGVCNPVCVSLNPPMASSSSDLG